MEALPNEILLEVFQYLTLYSQIQCLQVCKLWNAAARVFVNSQKIELYENSDANKLVQDISSNPIRGLSIRQMFFHASRSGNNIQENKLFLLMARCPNLAEIVIVDKNPIYYISCLLRKNLDLPKLEVIRFERCTKYAGYLKDRLNLSFKYRNSLNQTCIAINRRDLKGSLLHRVENYVQSYTNLKCLSLTTSCPLVFDALIKACPQLQILNLKLHPGTSFQVTEDSNTGDQGKSFLTEFQTSQLEVLKIDQDYMTADLYEYLRCCCKFLSHLVLFISYHTDPLLDTFEAFQTNSLPLTTISIIGNLSGAKKAAQGLCKWFPRVDQVGIDCFNWACTPFNNISLDFRQTNLLCLFLNIHAFFSHRIFGLVERIALEIVTRSTSVWYHHEGIWDTDTQFVLQDNVQYASESSREARRQSYETAVISIEAQSIQMLYIYSDSHQRTFTQVIHLSQ